MEIIVKKGEGVSQAIKRKLLEAGAKSSDFAGSIWNNIQQSLQDNESTIEQKRGTSKIGDLWTTLRTNVKTFIGDVIRITDATWEKIKSFVGLGDDTPETSDTAGTDSTTSASEVDETEATGDADETDDVDEVEDDDDEKTEETEDTGEYSAEDIKVTVNKRKSSDRVRQINSNIQSGKAQVENLKKGKTEGLTSKNVAYAMNESGVMFGPNSQKQAEIVFELLYDRLRELGLFVPGKDYGMWRSVSKLSYAKQNEILHSYKKRIIDEEQKIRNNEIKEMNDFNKDVPKMQEQFDKSNEFLVEVANMNPKPEITMGHNDDDNFDYATLTLPDGRCIQVVYDEKGEITEILISHDTEPDHKPDGTPSDGAEVMYTKDSALVDTDKRNNKFEYSITSGYAWEAIKKIAEAIFGKGPKAE